MSHVLWDSLLVLESCLRLFFGFDIYFGMTNRKPSFLIRIANRPFCATHLRALLISLQRGDWRSLQMFLTEGAPLSGPAAAPVADVLRLLMADPTEKPTSTSAAAATFLPLGKASKAQLLEQRQQTADESNREGLSRSTVGHQSAAHTLLVDHQHDACSASKKAPSPWR